AIINRLREAMEKNGAPKAAEALVEEIGLYDDLRDAAASAPAADRRIGNVKDMIASLEGRTDLRRYLQLLALRSSSTEEKGNEETVTLTTLHGSKGLEFPVVFLVGIEEGLLPHSRTLNPTATDVMNDSLD